VSVWRSLVLSRCSRRCAPRISAMVGWPSSDSMRRARARSGLRGRGRLRNRRRRHGRCRERFHFRCACWWVSPAV
jgi:hypothetical protein